MMVDKDVWNVEMAKMRRSAKSFSWDRDRELRLAKLFAEGNHGMKELGKVFEVHNTTIYLKIKKIGFINLTEAECEQYGVKKWIHYRRRLTQEEKKRKVNIDKLFPNTGG